MIQKVGKINCVLRKGEQEMGDEVGGKIVCWGRVGENFIRINLQISSCLAWITGELKSSG